MTAPPPVTRPKRRLQLRAILWGIGLGGLVYVAGFVLLLTVGALPEARRLGSEAQQVETVFLQLRDVLESMSELEDGCSVALDADEREALRARARVRAILDQVESFALPPSDELPVELRLPLAQAVDLYSSWCGHASLLVANLELGREREAREEFARIVDLRVDVLARIDGAALKGVEDLTARHARLQSLAQDARRFGLVWLLLGLLFFPTALALLHRRLLAPLGRIEDGLDRIAQGDLGVRLEPEHDDELGRLVAHLDRTTQALQQRAHVVAARQRRTESDLERSEESLRAFVEHASDVVLEVDQDQRVTFATPSIGELTGREAAELVGAPVSALFAAEDRARVEELLRTVPGDRPSDGELFHWAGGAGRTRAVEVRLARRATGHVLHARDLTELMERESDLRQAQKLELVGRLTGGIAHDFNNLLTVVLGNVELALDLVPDGTPLREVLEEARDAAERGSDLTSRLLAYARRQPLRPAVLDLNELVRGMEPMLRRVLEEDVEVETVFAGGLWPCTVDRNQVENAVLNLVVNARDAMPDGGKLTIETGNAHLSGEYSVDRQEVAPGQYVQLSVSDTGVGIPADLIERVFEPFFTTKGPGQGSGLGLSMVFGFVKQSGGHVQVYSEEGEGTTVKLYLPRAHDPVDAGDQPERAPRVPVGAGERVLLVEDDEHVRTLTARMLEGLGYTVVTARTGDEALALGAAGQPFDLLLTDVVLPGGVGGPEVARTLKARQPALAVVFASGYTENAIVHHGRLDPGVLLLEKPFQRHELAQVVREALAD